MASALVRRSTAFTTSAGTTWAALANDGTHDVTIAAAAGDVVEVGVFQVASPNAVYTYLDAATMVSGSATNWVSTGTSSNGSGVPHWFTGSLLPSGTAISGGTLYTVQSGDIVSGNVTFRLYAKTSSSTRTFPSDTTDRAYFYAVTRYTTPATVTAASAATLPSLTASVAGLTTIPAAVAATLPGLTASAAASVTVTAASAAALPSLSASVVATADDTVPGSIAATLPSLTSSADVTATYPAEITATLPPLSASVAVTVTLAGADTISATLPSLSSAVVVDSGISLDPWVSGASGEALLNLEAEAGVLDITYPAEAAPAAIVEVPLQWQSHESATVGGDTSGMTSVDVGTPHVWVDGVDVTYFRGVPTRVAGWKTQAPHAWTTTTLQFPKVFHYEEAGAGDLEWMHGDAPVEIALVTTEGDRIHRFTGQLTSDDPGTGRGRTISEWGVEGLLWQSSHSVHQVPARLDPTDIGKLIPDELNGTPSRRFSPIARTTTGILSRQRGSIGQSRWDYSTDLLAKATVDGGDQWTLEPTGPRSFALVLKDTTTVHWTITAGAPGVELDLSHDHHERIDAVYGRGVGPDGYAWRNVFFPDLLPYDPPAYPYADPDQNVLLGDTDADTLTGTGISDWQRRIRELGYTSLPVDGVMGSEDIAAVRWIQRRQGIEVDGFMAGQTWAASWNVGAVGGDLRTIRLPMAVRPEVEQFIYAANGAIVGTNPAYDPSIIRHEVDIDFGAGVTKAQGREMAQRILERGLDPGIVGTIKLTTCPWEGSRWLVDAGDNVLVKGFRGEDVLCRITDVDADLENLTVTLTVDSEFRDAMAVVQILDRNRESKADPARRPGNPNRRSRMDQDQVTPFEGESPAGRLPKLPLYEGHWTVWPVPVSEVGLIAKLRIWTTGPACRFAVALFGTPVTANQIAAKVPDPLAVSNPWQAAGDDWLDSVGWIEGWGEEGQAAGYGMLGSESEGDPVTGVLYDDAGVPYVSLKSPWLWVALYSPTSCFIQGRIYPDPTQ